MAHYVKKFEITFKEPVRPQSQVGPMEWPIPPEE